MKNQTLAPILGVAAFCLVAVVMLAVWQGTRPAAQTGEKEITVTVVHKDGSERVFTYSTEHEYLGDLLAEEGLISGSEGPYGLFVDTVDGETAVFEADGGWWQLFCNGESVQTGADTVVIEDGTTYHWIYTVD